MDVALDTIIVRIVVYRRESEKRNTVDATVSRFFGLSRFIVAGLPGRPYSD
jgi:hypothetical protein